MDSTIMMKNYAKMLLERVGYTGQIAVKWEDQETASTNGVIITMPKVFLGIKLWSPRKTRPSKRTRAIIKGLLLHEIGHSLQPLADISKVERATNLNHQYVNILLDVHLERVAMVAFKSEIKNLYAVRRLVRRKMMTQYIEDLTATPDFTAQAMNLNLIDRFRQYNAPYKMTKRIRKFSFKIGGRLAEFDRDTMLTPGLAADLPAQVQKIADLYPELCDPNLQLPDVPGASAAGFPGLIPNDEPSATELKNAGDRMVDILETVFVAGKRNTPKREAQALAAKLKVKLSRNNATMRVLAPQTFDRRKLATGNIQPYYADRSVGKNKARRCAILLDTSQSMVKEEIQEPAFIAAQAITLAVESQDGSVWGGQFGAYGVLDKDKGASLLFSEICTNIYGTSFKLLSAVWQFMKDGVVIVITDGDGTMPAVILPNDYKRTHVIKLGSQPAPGIELLGTLHHCPDIKMLPEIMLTIVN